MGRQRIAVIGSAGSGKSSFASELARRTQLPLFHLDQLYWGPGWAPMDDARWERCVRELASQERWIIDGNYGATLSLRVKRCDAIVFFDLPRILCVWGVVKRWWKHRQSSRPDLPEGCKEILRPEFLKWVWDYPRRSRPRIIHAIEAAESSVEIYRIQSRAEAREALQRLHCRGSEPSPGTEV